MMKLLVIDKQKNEYEYLKKRDWPKNRMVKYVDTRKSNEIDKLKITS